MNQKTFLKKIVDVLEKSEISYAVTGGMAVVAWGRPRYTIDADIVIELSLSQSKNLLQSLRKIDKKIYMSDIAASEAIIRKGEFNLIHPDGYKIDFWVAEDGAYAQP